MYPLKYLWKKRNIKTSLYSRKITQLINEKYENVYFLSNQLLLEELFCRGLEYCKPKIAE